MEPVVAVTNSLCLTSSKLPYIWALCCLARRFICLALFLFTWRSIEIYTALWRSDLRVFVVITIPCFISFHIYMDAL